MTTPSSTDPSATTAERPRRGGLGRAAIGLAAVTLVVGLAVGGAIGWKVEQRRVKDDVKESVRSKVEAQAQNIRPFGVVTKVDGNSVTVRLRTGVSETRTYRIDSDTLVDRGQAGSVRDVTPGAIVLLRTVGGGDTPTASEIIVLPKNTTFGGG